MLPNILDPRDENSLEKNIFGIIKDA